MPEIFKDLNIHPRFQHIIDILNSAQLQGFHEFTVIAPVLSAAMREVAALDQDMLAAEKSVEGGSGDEEH